MELRRCECGSPSRVYTNLSAGMAQAKICCTRCSEETQYFAMGGLEASIEAAKKYWNLVYLVDRIASLRMEIRNIKNPPPPPMSGEQLHLL